MAEVASSDGASLPVSFLFEVTAVFVDSALSLAV